MTTYDYDEPETVIIKICWQNSRSVGMDLMAYHDKGAGPPLRKRIFFQRRAVRGEDEVSRRAFEEKFAECEGELPAGYTLDRPLGT